MAAGCGARTNLDSLAFEVGGSIAFAGNAGTVTLGTGGSSIGGTKAGSGAAGSGCTGSLEVIQSNTGLCVAKMATIIAPGGYPNYSIDATEVTKGQYDAWLATNPVLPSSADVNCNYVTSYSEQGKSGVYSGIDADHHPVVYVDWCDTYAYCKGVNKRLCGAIGGGSNPFANYADPTTSQWDRACSSGGTYAFPYGNSYQASLCDGFDYWNDDSSRMQTVSVGSLANCVTFAPGFAGVYDLSGNVWEWEDSCSGNGSSASCRVRGGAFHDFLGSYIPCDFDNQNYRQSVGSNFGFRCCASG